MASSSMSYGVFAASLFLAACLTIIPMEGVAAILRPEWIALVMVYWTLYRDQSVGIMANWMVGLFWDVLVGTTLGLHAGSLALQAYLLLTMSQRLLLFPVLQQSVIVFAVIGINLMLFRWIDGFISNPAIDMGFLIPAVTSALLWPLLRFILHRLDN
ncbi:rod shape-determining protein MreD [Allohahella sp. A8]|jgi:rod shape-determining protein MreD|uniref:rod shape-determining protein MreD n=1 Tax=Allohahella sp. A8 TaxID=3141461 RepID=UPI000C0A3B42|nr:rod shape-determining protein MreD [Hahellaceae bacterium]|tara:strand:+ start:43085 stop:43555 length:471 start_codon:yes stop_codon:yes gene_type:complete